MLSKDELRKWLDRTVIKIKGSMADKGKAKSEHRLTMYCIARHLQVDVGNLWNMIRGNRDFPEYQRRMLTRFIQEWEAGEWEIVIEKKKKILKKCPNPRPKSNFKVVFDKNSLKTEQNTLYQPSLGQMPRKLWRE
jgi:hypothetical protein